MSSPGHAPHATVHWAGEALHLLPTHFVLAGHLHPVCQFSGPARDGMRLPCFVSELGQAVLPAFGAFTGGHALPAAPGRCFHAIGGQRVWALPGI